MSKQGEKRGALIFKPGLLGQNIELLNTQWKKIQYGYWKNGCLWLLDF
jgi:hypothetical protein